MRNGFTMNRDSCVSVHASEFVSPADEFTYCSSSYLWADLAFMPNDYYALQIVIYITLPYIPAYQVICLKVCDGKTSKIQDLHISQYSSRNVAWLTCHWHTVCGTWCVIDSSRKFLLQIAVQSTADQAGAVQRMPYLHTTAEFGGN